MALSNLSGLADKIMAPAACGTACGAAEAPEKPEQFITQALTDMDGHKVNGKIVITAE